MTVSRGGILSYGSFASSGSVSCNNGFSVTSGTVSFASNAVALGAVNGLATRLQKLDNLSGSSAVNSTITSNILTINYTSNNGQSIFITPTANFSLTLTNVPTGLVNAIYKLEIYINAKFYCTNITVNGTVITMVATQVNASASGLKQTFSIFFSGTTTPTRVNTMLFSTL